MPGEGETLGRNLSIAWYDRVTEQADGILVCPCAGGLNAGELALMKCTIAEMSRAAGHFPIVPENASARDVELLHEDVF